MSARSARDRKAAWLAVLSGPILVWSRVAAVDRPAVLLPDAEVAGHRRAFDLLTPIVVIIPPLAMLGGAMAAFFGWRPGPAGRALVACCVATPLAVAPKGGSKQACGLLRPETRVDANPSVIGDGAYGVVPFHRDRGWFSVPSGRATLVGVVSNRLPRWRPIPAIPVVLVIVGLYGADYHFVGDTLADLYLGAACGAGVLAILRQPAGTRLAAPP